MTYRFVKIASFYREFLKEYYKTHPNIVRESYEVQFSHLMDQGYGYSDYFSKHLTNLGNEANEIIHNVGPLQDSWAREHGLRKSGNDLILAQLKEYNAEVVLFQDSTHFSKAFIRSIKENVPTVRLLIGMCCSPVTIEHFEVYSKFDFMLGCSPGFTDLLSKNGLKNYLFYHSIEHSICENLNKSGSWQQMDVIFIGSFIGSSDYHDERLGFIEKLLESGINIQIISNLVKEGCLNKGLKRGLFDVSRMLKDLGLKNLAFSLPIIKKFAILNEAPKFLKFSESFAEHTVRESVYGIKMLERISEGKIGLNIHAGVSGEYAANVRMFEVTGAGSCLLTDDKKNIRDLFEPGQEIVTYGSIGECREKILWLLDNPGECREIARQGRERTLKDHSVVNRMTQLHDIITGYL